MSGFSRRTLFGNVATLGMAAGSLDALGAAEQKSLKPDAPQRKLKAIFAGGHPGDRSTAARYHRRYSDLGHDVSCCT